MTYRNDEGPRYRELTRLAQSRGTDTSLGCAFMFALLGVGLLVFVRSKWAFVVPVVGTLYFASIALLRAIRWRGVAVDLALDADGLVANETTSARLRLHGSKRVARATVILTVYPPLTGDVRYRWIAPRYPLASIEDWLPGSRVIPLTPPADVRSAPGARYVVLVELDDLRGDPMFVAQFAVDVLASPDES